MPVRELFCEVVCSSVDPIFVLNILKKTGEGNVPFPRFLLGFYITQPVLRAGHWS
jgi:hypothetical protein